MLSERRGDAVVVWAPAKVNLFLEVRAKRPDGYHELATLMVAVGLYDTLIFKEDAPGTVDFSCDHAQLSTGPDNLVVRAASLLRQQIGTPHGARIRLTKRIPLAAGLAGGSSDAAATLAGLNQLWRLEFSSARLAALGAELGSDVAFFFSPPAAWCTGRGEIVRPLALGQVLWFVLVYPGVGLATKDVFARVTVPPDPLEGREIREAVQQGTAAEIGRWLFNRLQPVAEGLCPAVAAYERRLQECRPAGHLMSGSGPSLFALCRSRADALRIARQLRFGPEEGSRPSVFIVRSCC